MKRQQIRKWKALAVDDLDLEEAPLTAADLEDLRQLGLLGLTSCDFVGDSGCVDPECWRCHSPLRPENLCTLAKNLATAAMLCWSWQLRNACPTWKPGCGEPPVRLPSLMKAALASSRIGVFLGRSR